ncbi:MAG: hypothetical protein K0S24_4392 [Sphingobacterium sp.]|jgi:hypothetical protein|nr:hypothetical protein [Sphingobacterium sp.]
MAYTKDGRLFEPFISAYLLYSVKAGWVQILHGGKSTKF